jgi:arylformamidase
MSKLIDVSMRLSPSTPTMPGEAAFEIEPLRRLESGDPFSSSRLAMGTHTGTHVDAPRHVLTSGVAVDELPLEILVGKARVVEIPVRGPIGRADLESLDLRDDLRVLIKTHMSGHLHNGSLAAAGESVALTADAAAYLVQAGIKLVGLDSLSIEDHGRLSADGAHAQLLSAGVVVVEGLDLTDASAGEYELYCLPLAIAQGDGAPARVLLKERT